MVGELELGWRLTPNRFVAVTGTNGKTTVTEWLGHVFATAGMPARVAGNVGTPLASLGDDVDPEVTIVCECSSFQLEDSVAFAPEVAVLLNFSPDHLDRHGTLEAYLDAKLRIFASQPAGATAICDADEPALRDVDLPGAAQRLRYGIECSSGGCSLRLEDGAIHDDEGVLVERSDICAGRRAQPPERDGGGGRGPGGRRPARCRRRAGSRSFAGVPHRLEPVAEIDGVAYVNDSKATNVAAAGRRSRRSATACTRSSAAASRASGSAGSCRPSPAAAPPVT